VRRRAFLALGGGAAIAAAGALAGACRRGRDSLVVAASPHVTMAPLHLAVEEGYFTAAGLDLRLERLASARDGIPAMAGGQLDVAFLPLSAGIVNAILRGARLRIVAGREHVRPGCREYGMLTANPRSFPGGFTSLRQLEGRRLASASQPGSLPLFFVDTVLEHAGLTRDDLILDDVGSGAERLQGVLRGRYDASLGSDAHILRPELRRELIVVSAIAKLLPAFQFAFILFGARLVDGDPAVGIRFLDAYHRAVREYLGGRTPRFLREYADSNDLDYEAIRTQCRATLNPTGAVDAKSVQQFLNWTHRKGYTDRRVDASEVIDRRFVDAARSAGQ